jgi:hypothetical protein
MRKLGLAALALGVGVATVGCAGSDDRPKNHHFVTGGGGGVGGGGSGGGSGGVPCTPAPGQGTTFTADVVTHDVYLSAVESFPGQAEIKGPGASCPSVSTTWDGLATDGPNGGPAPFQLAGLRLDEALFIRAYQLPTSALPVYPTLMAVNTNSDVTALGAFGFVRAQGIDEAYAATGTTWEPDKGTMLVAVVAPLTFAPLAGVKIDVGVNGSAAYPGLSGWQLGGETDASGLALMLNTLAKPYPGQSLTVNVALGADEQKFSCPTEAGAVTVCRILMGGGFNP